MKPIAMKTLPDTTTSTMAEIVPVDRSSGWARSARVALLILADGTAVIAAGVAAYYLWALPIRVRRRSSISPARRRH